MHNFRILQGLIRWRRSCDVCLLTFLCLAGTVARSASVSQSSLEALKQIVEGYQKVGLVKMQVEKKVTSDLLGTDRTYLGKLAMAEKRFRFETEDTLVVYDGHYLWNVQRPMKGSGGKVQVARGVLNQKNQGQVVLTDLLMGQSILKHFDFLSEKTNGSKIELAAKPKIKDDQVQDLTITIDKNVKQISQINYSDDLGNKTSMRFRDVETAAKSQPKTFQYTPGPDDVVTDL